MDLIIRPIIISLVLTIIFMHPSPTYAVYSYPELISQMTINLPDIPKTQTFSGFLYKNKKLASPISININRFPLLNFSTYKLKTDNRFIYYELDNQLKLTEREEILLSRELIKTSPFDKRSISHNKKHQLVERKDEKLETTRETISIKTKNKPLYTYESLLPFLQTQVSATFFDSTNIYILPIEGKKLTKITITSKKLTTLNELNIKWELPETQNEFLTKEGNYLAFIATEKNRKKAKKRFYIFNSENPTNVLIAFGQTNTNKDFIAIFP